MLLASTPTRAQSPAPSTPGPFVVDIRGVTAGLPKAVAFHPLLPTGTLVPQRGFGLGVGAHVYVASLGPARVGIGVDVLRARGKVSTPASASSTSRTSTSSTTTLTGAPASALSAASRIDDATTLTAVAPQVSFSFGTGDGWSYLSAGYGAAQIRSAASGERNAPIGGQTTVVQDGGRIAAINFGGGARWFTQGRMAVGFDLRFHRLASSDARPSTRLIVLSIGVSVR